MKKSLGWQILGLYLAVVSVATAAASELVEPHIEVCVAMLKSADTTREVLGDAPRENEALLRYLIEVSGEVSTVEQHPERFQKALAEPSLRAKIALVNYVRVQFLQALERYGKNRELIHDLETQHDPEFSALAEDEKQILLREIQAHRDEIFRLTDQVLFGNEESGAVIMEMRPSQKLSFSSGDIEKLSKMYLEFARQQNWDIEIMDETSDEFGLRSLTLKFTGLYAKRWLNLESGTHRLISVGGDASSRANRNKTNTNYMDVTVYAEPQQKEFRLNLSDLEFQTFRSSGAGGQHVNTTDSAVRVRDTVSGTEVVIQAGRSQHRNRALAIEILTAKLFARAQEQQKAELDKLKTQKPDATVDGNRWVRTYDVRHDRAVYDSIMSGGLRDIFLARQHQELVRAISRQLDGK